MERTRGAGDRGKTAEHTELVRASKEGQESGDSRGRRRRQQEAQEGGKATQEEQDRQVRQGAGRIERNTRHNETFKCAMIVAWTSGRVRVKQRDRTT